MALPKQYKLVEEWFKKHISEEELGDYDYYIYEDYEEYED